MTPKQSISHRYWAPRASCILLGNRRETSELETWFIGRNQGQVKNCHLTFLFTYCRNASFLRRRTIPPCASSTLVLSASSTALYAASAGSLLSTVPSAVVQCPLTESFTCIVCQTWNLFVSAILKAIVRTSPGEWCEWDSMWGTVWGTAV